MNSTKPNELLQCAQRELGIRRMLYPAMVKTGKITAEKSVYETNMMGEICAHLQTNTFSLHGEYHLTTDLIKDLAEIFVRRLIVDDIMKRSGFSHLWKNMADHSKLLDFWHAISVEILYDWIERETETLPEFIEVPEDASPIENLDIDCPD